MTGGWGIHPLHDRDGRPIVNRQLRGGDYVLLSGPDGEVFEVQLIAQSTLGADTIGFHCQTINKEGA